MPNKFTAAFQGKTVAITGDTGFKGSWLTAWLLRCQAKVVGLSIDIPTTPSHYTAAGLEGHIEHIWGDVRNRADCVSLITKHRPDFVFHLAAQPLVRKSYAEPAETFETNVLGTLNMLEALRTSGVACTAVFITSDKCYDNVEQLWGYRESDRLGGKDPYSGSKGAAELVIKSYVESFFKAATSKVRIGVGRAGNVIGGGDWAEDRILPDAVRAWEHGAAVKIRNPRATRPWQHVLEPLSGYLTLACELAADLRNNGQAYNFGPPADQNQTVAELLDEMRLHWPSARWEDVSAPGGVYEAGLLKLCCDKALHQLSWKPALNFAETVRMSAAWYQMYLADGKSSSATTWEFTQAQIVEYESIARERNVPWTC